MSDNSDRLDRRTVLKGTSATLASNVLIGSAVAQKNTKDKKPNQPTIQESEIVADKDGIEVKRMVIEGRSFLFRHNYDAGGQIDYVELSPDSSLNVNNLTDKKILALTSATERTVTTEGVTTQEKIVEKTSGIKELIGNCRSWYSEHYYVGAAIKFADDIGTIGVAALAGVLCTAISRRFGGKFTKEALNELLDYVLGGGCSALGHIVTKKISGSELTIGFHDIDTGSADWPEIKVGISDEYLADYPQISNESTADGAHIVGQISFS